MRDKQKHFVAYYSKFFYCVTEESNWRKIGNDLGPWEDLRSK